ncbi:unnamed protein product [Blepharisma stoltei]|uniref:RING-type E3 ubiquitin transferase n=1 Tax=Blepharisma stoltei TaxID=1481888 RepID=A0AAU9JQY1_9CILI|nr:unnamed protein product [Blepharisma stoltei]
MEYWCHICKRESQINEETITCSSCGSNFVELIEDEEQHPRNFVPYQPAQSIRNLLSSLLLSSLRSGTNVTDTDATMDQIIHHLMMNDTNRYGPPPASQGAISTLPSVKINQEVIKARGRLMSGFDECGERIEEDRVVLECSVCKEEFGPDEEAIDMPCQHMFHQNCLIPWLKEHNNCPVCRFELPTDDPDYEQRRGRS